ncbi:unnamed protein product [Tilletia controversa]|nr:unnamed protein product [Tilletia controversa]
MCPYGGDRAQIVRMAVKRDGCARRAGSFGPGKGKRAGTLAAVHKAGTGDVHGRVEVLLRGRSHFADARKGPKRRQRTRPDGGVLRLVEIQMGEERAQMFGGIWGATGATKGCGRDIDGTSDGPSEAGDEATEQILRGRASLALGNATRNAPGDEAVHPAAVSLQGLRREGALEQPRQPSVLQAGKEQWSVETRS